MNLELLTVTDVAGILRCSEDTVLRRFKNRKGVVDLGSPETRRKKPYRIIRIPRPVLEEFIMERTR